MNKRKTIKSAFKAKVIVVSDNYDVPVDQNALQPLSMRKIIEHINSGKIEIEAIDDYLTNDVEPVLIITLK